jgi:hypothetical protein
LLSSAVGVGIERHPQAGIRHRFGARACRNHGSPFVDHFQPCMGAFPWPILWAISSGTSC